MHFLRLVLVLIFYNGQIAADTKEELLKVTSGSGISFIDLWNLKGKTVGSKNDAVYRNGLIDRGFSKVCPYKIYFQLRKNSQSVFYIIYQKTNSVSANLSALMKETIKSVAYTIPTNQITMKLRPQNGVDFWMKNNNTKKYYVTILFDRTHGTGPIFYHSGDNVGYKNPLSGAPQADYLLVRGKYDTVCLTTAPTGNIKIPTDQVIKELYPTPGPVVSTYPPQVTTTDESSTESAEMSTAMTDTLSTEKIDVSTFVADQSTTEKTGVSTPLTDTRSSDTTTSQISQSSTKGTTDETVKMCPCSCEFRARLDMLNTRSNLSLEELRKQMQPELDEIKRRYTWDKTKTSAFKRKKISAADKRKSSEQIGVVAGSFIAVVVGLVILVDVVAIKRHVGVFRRHFWGEETRPDEEAELVDTRKKKSKMKKEKKQKSKQ